MQGDITKIKAQAPAHTKGVMSVKGFVKYITRKDYYDQKEYKSEYYTAGEEEAGFNAAFWQGKGAEALGLSGEVTQKDLEQITMGFDLKGNKIGSNHKNRETLAFDITNSVPKSVSIAFAFASPDEQQKILKVIAEANAASMKVYEDNVSVRVGHNGEEKEQVKGLTIATVVHASSRALDPQLHVHNAVNAMALKEDGTYAATDHAEFLKIRKFSGAVFNAVLAKGMNGLGYKMEQDEKNSWTFRIKGISKEAEKEFSKSRQNIIDELEKKGIRIEDVSKKLISKVAKQVREDKDEPAFKELLEIWKIRGKQLGLTAGQVGQRGEATTPNFVADVTKALEEVTTHQTEYTETQLREAIATQAAISGGASLDDINKAVDAIQKSSDVIALGHVRNTGNFGTVSTDAIYTSKTRLQEDFEMLKIYKESARDTSFKRDDSTLEKALKSYQERKTKEANLGIVPDANQEELLKNNQPVKLKESQVNFLKTNLRKRQREEIAEGKEITLSKRQIKILQKGVDVKLTDEQLNVLKHSTQKGRISFIEGFAGTGKSFAIGAVAEAEREAGQTVLGTSLQKTVATDLVAGAGLKTQDVYTTKQLLIDIQTGKLKPDAKTTLIVDEAGMISNSEAHKIFKAFEHSKIIFLGDREQYSSINQGGYFAGLIDEGAEVAQLKNITRQKEDWAKQSVLDFKNGETLKALDEYDKREKLHFFDSEDAALKTLADSYIKDKNDLVNKEMTASTHVAVNKLNAHARESLIKSGFLGSEETKITVLDRNDEEQELSIRLNERVRFTKNEKKSFNASNGQKGTVIEIDGKTLTIKKDTGEIVKVNTNDYKNLWHGYARTGHISQGKTDNVNFNYIDRKQQTRNAAYVMNSRHRFDNQIFTTRKENETSEQAKKMLAGSMQRLDQKKWAVSFFNQQQREELAKSGVIPMHEHQSFLQSLGQKIDAKTGLVKKSFKSMTLGKFILQGLKRMQEKKLGIKKISGKKADLSLTSQSMKIKGRSR